MSELFMHEHNRCKDCGRMCKYILSLEAERDRQVAWGKELTKEISRLKAEVEKWQGNFQLSRDECLKWKAKAERLEGKTQYCAQCEVYARKAEKMAGALRKIERGQNEERSIGMDTPLIAVSRDQLRMLAKAALGEGEGIIDDS